MARALGGRIYYGWVVVGVTVLALLVAAGVRSAPGILILPLEEEFGWGRSAISFAASVGLLLYGAVGPVAGGLMDRFGPRRLMLLGLALTAVGTLAGAAMTQLWQLNLAWGVLTGIGTGASALVLGATVANRWFDRRRGLVLGIFGAATSAGQLVFVPLLMWLVDGAGWRVATLVLTGCAAAILVPVLTLMRDDPADLGLAPDGAPLTAAALAMEPGAGAAAGAGVSGGILGRAARTPEFWLLSGSFFICGATSNGLIGTHFIPHSIDHGIPETTAAGALGLMGAMNFVGTVASGWLTDRRDPRLLLAIYYALRGLSLLFLPFVAGFPGLAVWAVVFGLDYIATVPPTAALVADRFGRRHVGAVFGWVFLAHQLGAALAAYGGGLARDALGDYRAAFLTAGVLAVLAALMTLRIDRSPAPLRGTAAAPAD